MTRYLSNKLTILYTVLIIMVVYIHSYYLEAEQYPFAKFLQTLTGGGICRIANCLFFCLSGYLFARNVTSQADVWRKMKKRFSTLLPPYLIWNVIFVLWYVGLELIPGISRWVNSGSIVERILHQSLWQTAYDLWIVPAGFQLWFLRDLLAMVIFTPVLCGWAKKHWPSALMAALVATVIYSWLTYFWIGIIMAVQKVDVDNYPRPRWAMIAAALIFVTYALYVPWRGMLPPYVEVIPNLAGLYVLWMAYDLLARGNDTSAHHGLWKWICGYSFFIYLFHEPTFNIVKKLTLACFGQSEGSLILLYYINPWMMVALAIAVAKMLQHALPRVYNILTGGR